MFAHGSVAPRCRAEMGGAFVWRGAGERSRRAGVGAVQGWGSDGRLFGVLMCEGQERGCSVGHMRG